LNAFLSAGTGGGVAWYAHIGGFLAGILLIGIFKRRDVHWWSRRRDDYL
jgi:membrane associated rhomboid family serine protease